MPALSEYSNVYNTALLILEQKGFRVWYDESSEAFGCERDGWDFFADSPTSLLGLVAIYEFKEPAEFAEYWWREDGQHIYNNMPKNPPEYTSIVCRK